MKNKTLARLLDQRGMNVDKIADQIFSHRGQVTLVLLGRRSGQPTWNKLKKVLTKDEMSAAQAFANTMAAQRLLKQIGLYEGRETGAPDAALVSAVQRFQTESQMKVRSGALNEETMKALNLATKEKRGHAIMAS